MGKQCRFCKAPLKETFADLGMTPLANSFIKKSESQLKENFYPLHAFVCEQCLLVQLEEFESPKEIFSDYAYFSSFSESWLDHAKHYADNVISRFDLNEKSQVIEIASNDGYLLQYFIARNIPVLGIEPAENIAKVAIEKGIPTLVNFFGLEAATQFKRDRKQADLIVANNVLAHVPDLCDFVAGMKELLNPYGVITIEFPHLLRLIENNQFDTIYHEHFSYFSFLTVNKVFSHFGLTIFDVEELQTHGGSLRIYIHHSEDNTKPMNDTVTNLIEKEMSFGLDCLETYCTFAEKVREAKRGLLDFLIKEKRLDKTIVGYGAPAKGNTLLNYCGIRTDFIDYTVDRNPYKQGCALPGVRIPIEHPDKIKETKPDYVLILPWNIKDEVMQQLDFIKEWGGKFVIPIPKLKVIK